MLTGNCIDVALYIHSKWHRQNKNLKIPSIFDNLMKMK